MMESDKKSDGGAEQQWHPRRESTDVGRRSRGNYGANIGDVGRARPRRDISIRGAQHLHSLLTDVVTLETLRPPLVVASDGYTYNLHSLRSALEADKWRRSPITGEVLRATAYRALGSEAWLASIMKRAAAARARGRGAGAREGAGSLLSPSPAEGARPHHPRAPRATGAATTTTFCVYDSGGELARRPEHVPSGNWASVDLDMASAPVTPAALSLADEAGVCDIQVRVAFPVMTKRGGLPVIMTPPPECSLMQGGAELAAGAGWQAAFQNASHLVTAVILCPEHLAGRTLEELALSGRCTRP